MQDAGLYWSDELYQIFGLDPEKGAPEIGQYLTLIHPQDQASMAETIKTMFQEHCGCDVTKRIVRPDGQVRYVRCVASPVIEQEVFKGFLGTAMDVTEQELLTQELRREQAYLAEAQSLAHIGSWATNFATRQNFHLSNETYRIHGFDPRQGPPGLERFWATLHPQDEPLVRATLEDAVRAGTDYDIRDFRICRAADVINRLRSFYKKGSPPKREMVDVREIIQEMTALLRTEAFRHSVRIHSELHEERPHVLADRVQLQQVFMNLMLNAIEAMKDSGGELTITSRLNPEGQLVVSISDTGVGLPADSAERIFDAFHTTNPQGTGMGLAISRSIVEAHGGRVWAPMSLHDRAGNGQLFFSPFPPKPR